MPRGRAVAWPEQLIDYLVECYAGTEDDRSKMPHPRRMFLWEHGTEVRFGNIEAFAEHVIEKFGIDCTQRAAASWANRRLIEMGEAVRPCGKSHCSPQPGNVIRPQPEYTVIS